MATISIAGDMLTVHLTWREKIAAARGDLSVPLAAVRGVRVQTDALAAVRGVRAPGAAIPGRLKMGVWRGRGRRSFVIARRGTPALVATLERGRYDELIVSVENAQAIADEIHARLADLHHER